jgi:hypothetical protein
MNSSRRRSKMSMPLALTWTHREVLHRVTPWPDVQFERVCANGWIAVHPTEEMLAAAARGLRASDWAPYLEFVPVDVREFIERFPTSRMQALEVVARCPALLTALAETPSLTAFLAAHAGLRGTEAPRWNEINAVNERSGIFGVLEWLGLPASRQTLSILHHIIDPELPAPLLEMLRAQLWEPGAIFALQRLSVIDARQLTATHHALAA